MSEIESDILQRLLKEEIIYDGDLGNPPLYINGNNQLNYCKVCNKGTIVYFEISRLNYVCPFCVVKILKSKIIEFQINRNDTIAKLQNTLDCDALLPMYRACLQAKIDVLKEVIEYEVV